MEEQTQVEQVVQEQPIEQKTTTYENNIVMMRKKLEAEEAARLAAEKRIKELESNSVYASNRAQLSSNNDTDGDDIGADPDDYLQVKHFKKNTSRIQTKLSESERRLQELNDRIERYEAQASLKEITDFDDVVTTDNIETLKRLYPEDWETAMSNPNLKNKAKTMYNMISKYGVAPQNTKANEDKINKNKSKPSVPGSTGQTAHTPLAKLNDYDRKTMTEEDRERILARLEQMKRGR